MIKISMIHECILYGASRSTLSTHDVLLAQTNESVEFDFFFCFHSHPPAAVKSSCENRWWVVGFGTDTNVCVLVETD